MGRRTELNDAHRALVLEGGGMRGVYTAGVLEAFDDAGMSFGTIVACSAGACAAASFLAGQTWRNRRVYLDYLDGRKLVRYARLLTGGSVMDIDYLIDDVTLGLVPLDFDALRSSRTRLEIPVTDWQTGDVRYLKNHVDDPVVALKATCALPFFYRGHVSYEGRRYVDGGVGDPVPIARAIELGAKDVTVVLTSPIESRGRPKRRIPGVERLFSSSAAIRRALRERYLRYRRAAELIETPPEGVVIRAVRPSTTLSVSRTTTERARLEAGCDLGRADGRTFVSRRRSPSPV